MKAIWPREVSLLSRNKQLLALELSAEVRVPPLVAGSGNPPGGTPEKGVWVPILGIRVNREETGHSHRIRVNRNYYPVDLEFLGLLVGVFGKCHDGWVQTNGF